jgi:hypothetical protein
MRDTKRQFSSPLSEGLKPPAKPIGQETRPSRRTAPPSGFSTPEIKRNNVDLPAPLRPKMPIVSRDGKTAETLLSTTLGPAWVPYVL